MSNVLIVEDEANLRELMTDLLPELDVQTASCLADARTLLEKHQPDLLLLDLKLPDGDGLELLGELRGKGIIVPAIIITAFGTIERAAAAMRAGACDFVVKPFDKTRFVTAVLGALEARRRLEEVELRAGDLVGAGGGLRDVVALLARVASTDATVLIQGESGTGKELIARAIHESSPRLDGPFVSINCSAIAPTLLESELFGFERGAFTGAHAQRKGLVEAAEEGTLFLDEIGDMPLEAQAKLLRVLQEREIMRIGGREPIGVDVRVIAATHRDLAQMAREGRFREDLRYRLEVVPIRVPPLRERKQDIPGLVDHFLVQQAKRHGVRAPVPSREVLDRLQAHDWPGNVRELQNTIERAVILGSFEPAPAAVSQPAPPVLEEAAEVKTLRQAVQEAERRAVVAALRAAKGNKAQAARLLGVSYKTLFNKIHEHDIREAISID
jgi:DNA-binding NtrC family response regulator